MEVRKYQFPIKRSFNTFHGFGHIKFASGYAIGHIRSACKMELNFILEAIKRKLFILETFYRISPENFCRFTNVVEQSPYSILTKSCYVPKGTLI